MNWQASPKQLTAASPEAVSPEAAAGRRANRSSGPSALPLAIIVLCSLTATTTHSIVASEPATEKAVAANLSLRCGEIGRGGLQMVLPPRLFAVVGVEQSLYFANLVREQDLTRVRFEVDCAVGKVEGRRWLFQPTAADIGEHTLSVRIVDRTSGDRLNDAKTKLHVIAADSGDARNRLDDPLRLLIIGDSLTHASLYPNRLAELLDRPGNPAWKMLGTHRPAAAADRVAHEGYGGWTWQRFATRYEPNPDGTYRKRSSPFVYLRQQEPTLDFARYWKESCEGQRPDYVIIMLGINDCFSADADNPDPRIDAMLAHADRLLAALRKSAPETEVGICLTTPPNSRDQAFEANYKGRYPQDNWKRIQHRLVQRQIEKYSSGNEARVTIVPTHLNLDPTDGYPENNGVHPNADGYRQIGDSIYAWLKWRLAAAVQPTVQRQPNEVETTDQKIVKTTVAYREVAGHKVLLDVYRPQGDEMVPVIVWIHGGALIMGHREGIHQQVRQLAAERGYALVSIDYRLAPETKLPELISDVEAAFQWVGGVGAKTFHLDPDRIVVTGGSAGGYLTLVSGYRAKPRPTALVALYGYGDLMGPWYTTPSPHPRHNSRKISAAEAAKQTDGSIVSDARRRKGNGGLIYLHYRQNGSWPANVSGFAAESIREKIAPYEPLRNVDESYPPTLLIHGTRDTDVPFEQSTMMKAALKKHSVPCRLIAIENGEHGFGGADADAIAAAYREMRAFIVHHLQK